MSSSFDSLLSPDSPANKKQEVLVCFRSVCRLFQHFSSGDVGILPVYARSKSQRAAVLAVDYVADVWNSSRRVLGKPIADVILSQILDDGFGGVDDKIQIALGTYWSQIDLLGVYSAVCSKRTQDDAGVARKHKVQFEAEAEAESLLKDVSPEDMQDVSEEIPAGEPQSDWFGEDQDLAA